MSEYKYKNKLNYICKFVFQKKNFKKASYESQLRPNLGHPSKLDILNHLDLKESKRQETNDKTVEEYIKTLKVGKYFKLISSFKI